MNPAEQTVTWLIALGVLESPKKRVSDPESFLQSSLRDGVVLCRLLERLRPGSLLTVKAAFSYARASLTLSSDSKLRALELSFNVAATRYAILDQARESERAHGVSARGDFSIAVSCLYTGLYGFARI